MVSYIKAMSTLSRRFQSGNSVPIESARITKEEFDAIQDEIESLIETNESLNQTLIAYENMAVGED